MDTPEEKSESSPDSVKPVDEHHLPPPDLMRDFILSLKEPTIVQGGTNNWDLLKWNLNDWSRSMGDSKLPFRVGKRECTLHPQWENTCRTFELSLDEFLHHLEKDNSVDEWMYFDYKYMNQWFKSHNTVMESVSWDALGFSEFRGEDSTMWLGSKGAHTPCHYDAYSLNIVAQIYGKKMWIMFPPDCSNELQPTRVPYEESSIYSKLNFYCGNSDFSGLDDAYFVILEPGDVLIVPNQWWHYVENLSTAVSINVWIPLENDDEIRLEECLVKNFVLSSVKDLPINEQKRILNPNESSLINNEEATGIEQLNLCCKLCKSKSNVIGSTIHKSDFNLDDHISIRPVSKMNMIKVKEFLQKKCKCNRSKSHLGELTPSKLTVDDYINAFCQPDIIKKVTNNFLNKR